MGDKIQKKNQKKEKVITPEESILNGIGLALFLITFAIFLYVKPAYLGPSFVTWILGLSAIVLGVIGLSVELNKINGGKTFPGFADVGVGLGFTLVWAVLHSKFPYLWVNYLLLALLIPGLYGLSAGTTKIIYGIATGGTKKGILVKVFLSLVQAAATFVTLYEVLKKLNILK